MKATRIFVLFLVIAVLGACKQQQEIAIDRYDPDKLRIEIRLLADSVADDNYIGTEQMGRMPQTAPSFLRRQKLMHNASPAELLSLTHHPNTVVKLVAFEGLTIIEHASVTEVLKRFLSREDEVHYIRGDISMRMPMLEFAYVYILHHPLPGETLPDEIPQFEAVYHIDEDLKSKVVSRILELRKNG